MSGREPFAYAILRVIPDAVRGEAVNAGLILFCRGRGYLAARTSLPTDKLRALRDDIDIDGIQSHLRSVELVAAGDAAGGPMASAEPSARFNWLVAPASTIVQPSEVHTGLSSDPEQTLARLFRQLVA